jgi:hypothetical protein
MSGEAESSADAFDKAPGILSEAGLESIFSPHFAEGLSLLVTPPEEGRLRLSGRDEASVVR